VLTFIPGVYEQFQRSSHPDDYVQRPAREHAGARRWSVAAAGFLGFVTLRVFSREFKVRSL